jgi:hypothetical protein
MITKSGDSFVPSDLTSSTRATPGSIWKVLTEFNLPNQPDSDRLAGEQLLEVLKELGLSRTNSRLKTAICAAILNTIEPDRQQPERPIRIRVLISELAILGKETTQSQRSIPDPQAIAPASLMSGEQLPRGWGFFLIHKTENREQTRPEDSYYLIELFLYREDDLSRSDPTTGEVP